VARTVTLVVYVLESVSSGTEIVNTAETYSSTTDPNPSDNRRTVRTTVTSTQDELVIATNSLPLGRVGVPYSATLTTVNGIEPLTWFIVGGWLPDGMYLNTNGTLAGAPAETGVFPFRVRVIDGDFRIVEKDLSLRVLTAGRSVKSDFDGDGKTDLAFWRGHSSDWRIIRSANGSLQTAFWGTSNEPFDDIPTPGDYDGDGKTDVAIWRLLDSHWYIINSSDNSIRVEELGQGGDTPVPGDYDGDGKTDLAVWRGATSVWIIQQSSDGVVKEVSWGASYAPYKDVPVQADYDGDGKTDVAVWRGSTGAWHIIRSSDGAVQQTVWGASYAPYFDVPVPGDYDGDGRADVAVWRGATSDWWISRSSDNGILNVQWGSSFVDYLDIPTPGDYDGDGKTDIAVWRSETGVWYIIRSSDGGYTIREHGQPGDTPIPRF
ncbi:MAG: FG-GAP repeat domain-containing protein, partial [Blastocatellia bacterium]